MANTIGYAKVFQEVLDKVVTQQLTSGKLEMGAGLYKYNGGKTVAIADIALDGLANYSRSDGYASGNASLTWTDHTFSQDRGRRFDLDVMDIDESAFVADASVLLSEFGRTQIAPELDVYRFSSIAKKAYGLGTTNYTSALTVTKTNVFEKLTEDITKAVDGGFDPAELIAYMPWSIYNLLVNSSDIQKRLDVGTRTDAQGVETRFYKLNGVELVPVMGNRMKSGYSFGESGFAPVSGAIAINWLIVPKGGAVAIVKHNVTKVIAPEQNQKYDGYSVYARVYHDIFFPKNKAKGIIASFGGTVAAGAFNA